MEVAPLAPRRPPRTPFRKLVLASYAGCGGLVLLIAACTFGYMRLQIARRDVALEQLRARGAPVFMADLRVIDGPGPSADEWLRAASELDGLPRIDESAATITELERGLTREQRAELVHLDELGAPYCSLAEAARGLDPLTAGELLYADDPRYPAYVPFGPAPEVMRHLGLAVANRAQLRAVDGDFAGACAAARSLLDVAALWRTPPDNSDLAVPYFLMLQYLHACEDVMRLAPADFDADAALPELSREPWIEALRFAVAAEVARLDEQYAAGAPTVESDSPWPWEQWRVRACFHVFHVAAQRWQLDECERFSSAFGLTREQRRTLPAARIPPWYVKYGYATPAFVSFSLTSRLDFLDHIDARAALVRFARIARRSGAGAAAAAASATPDPYTDLPFEVERAAGRLCIRSRGLVVYDLLLPGCNHDIGRQRERLTLDWRDE